MVLSSAKCVTSVSIYAHDRYVRGAGATELPATRAPDLNFWQRGHEGHNTNLQGHPWQSGPEYGWRRP